MTHRNLDSRVNSTVRPYDILNVERRYESFRKQLVTDLDRLNTVLPLTLRLGRLEIDAAARDLVRTVRQAPHRRQRPWLSRLAERLRIEAVLEALRGRPGACTESRREESGDDASNRDAPSITSRAPTNVRSDPSLASIGPGEIRAANTNRPSVLR
jgi:hypothetical protein